MPRFLVVHEGLGVNQFQGGEVCVDRETSKRVFETYKEACAAACRLQKNFRAAGYEYYVVQIVGRVQQVERFEVVKE